ncbi:putative endonuclease 4|nr:putative endonuclease 4 [Neochlamydia sp. AcF84]
MGCYDGVLIKLERRGESMTTKAENLLIGAHTSAAGGVQNALYEGQEIGATTIQLFTSNQRQWNAKPLMPEVIDAWYAALKETHLQKIMSHASYMINLGAPDPENLRKSREAFGLEIERCLKLSISFLNFHPGAAIDRDPQECLDRIVESLLTYESLLQRGDTRLLLENTAGQGSAVGWRFEELAYIIDKVENRLPIGVCLDTCHLFAAGYDLSSTLACEETFKKFDQLVGFKHLYAFHLNDSLKGLGSRVDRHQYLGKGLIGIDCFKFLMNHPPTQAMPKYLETPKDPLIWKTEIQMLRDFVKS